MSSRINNSSGPRRNLSKVQQQLAAEEQARQKAIKDRRRREYLERQARRNRKARAKSSSSAPSSHSQSTRSVSHNGVTVEGNTITLSGLRSSHKKQQGLTLGDALSVSSKTALQATQRATKQNTDFKVSKGAFAAFDDSDDEDTPQPLVISTSKATLAHQSASASSWKNFRAGKPNPKPVQPKAVVRTLPPPPAKKQTPPAERPASPQYSSHSSDEDKPADAWSTDGDYDSDGAFGDDDEFEQFDVPEFDDDGY